MRPQESVSREEEAARWFAALRRGVMSIEERDAFAAWQSDRGNRIAFSQLERSWDNLEAARDFILNSPARVATASQPRYGRSAMVAAMCALSLGIGVLSYSGHSSFWTALDWTDR